MFIRTALFVYDNRGASIIIVQLVSSVKTARLFCH